MCVHGYGRWRRRLVREHTSHRVAMTRDCIAEQICVGRVFCDNSGMNWHVIVLIIAIVTGFLVIRRIGLISLEKARSHLRKGALLVDVRSTAEFKAHHLPGAMNVPLDILHSSAQGYLPDKKQVLLLHCHSGTRSAVACRVLKQMGYSGVFNVGSLGRAQKIIG